MPLSKDAKNSQLLNEVGNDITKAVEQYLKDNGLDKRLKDFDWEYALVESDVPNAWCMPGGKICFYTGILPYTKNADGMAVVMGHEIAHAVARHGNERMTQQLLVVAGGMALTEFVKAKPSETQNIFLNVFSVGAQVGILLPYSRKHEYEADRLGLIFMAMAGYNPEEAVEFWTRMSEMGGTKPPQFLSTHPSDMNRIANMKKCLPEAMTYYNKYK
jgi:predicted Zn-dependent protease